jgi:ATP-binding cassette subfamily B protein
MSVGLVQPGPARRPRDVDESGDAAIAREADILVSAIGRPTIVTTDFVKPGDGRRRRHGRINRDEASIDLAAYLARLPAAAASGLDDQSQANLAPPPAYPSFIVQLRAAGLIRRAGALLAAYVVETGVLIASWAFIGAGALNGRPDSGWGAAWALCLASLVPVRMTARWLEGVIAIGVGGLLKERLLAGATTMEPDKLRRRGAGEWLGDLFEVETIERLGAGGGLLAALASIELLAMPFLFAYGVAAALEIGVLLIWSAVTLGLVWANTRRRRAWTARRLELTHQLVEGMTAHRTRVVQQSASEWHREEDRQLDDYAGASADLDRSTAWLETVIPRGYTVVALAALGPSFVAGGSSIAAQAITLGAILFAADAFTTLTAGLVRASAARIAWDRARPLFDAAASACPEAAAGAAMDASVDDVSNGGAPGAQRSSVRASVKPPASGQSASGGTVLRAEDVRFTHDRRVEPVLRGCALTVERGDFVLLEGASGSGKSTLVSLLSGARTPTSGIVLAGGLDVSTLGRAAWRRRIAVAPQYHDNHVFAGSLGFNLLLGRSYPHSPHDLEEARELCLELGLGPLLDRMPAGLDQMVGEAGWQLSQGERSRVFLARALLQRADVLVIDESLSTLDPETLRQCQACLFQRAQTLIVVAHP